MKIVTVRIPSEWREHASDLKTFIENYAYHAGQQLKVSMAGEGQSHRVEALVDGTLTEDEKAALNNAVSGLNDRIANSPQAPSTAAVDANQTLEERSKKIDQLAFRQYLLKRILS